MGSDKKRIKQLANWLSNELRSGRGKKKLNSIKENGGKNEREY